METKKNNDSNKNAVMRELSDVVKVKYRKQSEEIINRAIEINQKICEENKEESKKVAMHTQEEYTQPSLFTKLLWKLQVIKRRHIRLFPILITKMPRKWQV